MTCIDFDANLCIIQSVPRRTSWFFPETNAWPLLTAMADLRRLCNNAEAVLPHIRQANSLVMIEAIVSAIDD
jgi:hypothetical protein